MKVIGASFTLDKNAYGDTLWCPRFDVKVGRDTICFTPQKTFRDPQAALAWVTTNFPTAHVQTGSAFRNID